MGQQLRSNTLLTKDMGSFSATHIGWLTTTYNSTREPFNAAGLRYRCSCVHTHTHTRAYTRAHAHARMHAHN